MWWYCTTIIRKALFIVLIRRDSTVGNNQLFSKSPTKMYLSNTQSQLQIQEYPGQLCSTEQLKDPGCFDLMAPSPRYVLSQQGKKSPQPLTLAIKRSGPHMTHYFQTQLIGLNKSHGSLKLGEDGEMSSYHMPKGEANWMWMSSMYQKILPLKFLIWFLNIYARNFWKSNFFFKDNFVI